MVKGQKICAVCGLTADCVHFGVVSCRACAAFFRRTITLGRTISESKCQRSCIQGGQLLNRYCKSCRFQKCLQSGMDSSSVQAKYLVKSEVKLHSYEIPTNSSILEGLLVAYQSLRNARKEIYRNESDPPKVINYKELSKICTIDQKLIYQHFISFLESGTPIDNAQKKLLTEHFMVPFALFDGAFRSAESDLYCTPNGNFVDIGKLENFYSNPEDPTTGIAEDVSKIMEPYWKFNQKALWNHLKEVKLDLPEFLLLAALIYWDFGIQQQSEDCIVVCKAMRSKIFEELAEHEKKSQAFKDPCLRVGEVVIVLQTVQKALDVMHKCRDISMVYNLYGRECPLFN